MAGAEEQADAEAEQSDCNCEKCGKRKPVFHEAVSRAFTNLTNAVQEQTPELYGVLLVPVYQDGLLASQPTYWIGPMDQHTPAKLFRAVGAAVELANDLGLDVLAATADSHKHLMEKLEDTDGREDSAEETEDETAAGGDPLPEKAGGGA